MEAAWEEPFGDRRQTLVLIGQDLDEAAHRAALARALLTDAELAVGPAAWADFEDPFPPWQDPGA